VFTPACTDAPAPTAAAARRSAVGGDGGYSDSPLGEGGGVGTRQGGWWECPWAEGAVARPRPPCRRPQVGCVGRRPLPPRPGPPSTTACASESTNAGANAATPPATPAAAASVAAVPKLRSSGFARRDLVGLPVPRRHHLPQAQLHCLGGRRAVVVCSRTHLGGKGAQCRIAHRPQQRGAARLEPPAAPPRRHAAAPPTRRSRPGQFAAAAAAAGGCAGCHGRGRGWWRHAKAGHPSLPC